MKIAVSGKGGVGKTLIAGGLAVFFMQKRFKTIAIDADPSPNLALTLGMSPDETRLIQPISENAKLIESKTKTGYSGVFRLSFTVDDIIRQYSVKTPLGPNLIVMGTVKSMGAGCTCPANAVVRALLRHFIDEQGFAVIVDMEAGVEHMGRGTAERVDKMLIVTDAGLKALETAKHIHHLALEAGMKQVFLVGNKIGNRAQREVMVHFAERNHLNILDFVPFDPKVAEAEIDGRSPLLDKNSEAVRVIESLGDKLTSNLT
ncbi:MAG: AAA family ATPase [Candidatus Bathyarchaeota archaeon]|nr:AAA family ATPase [Candidatus Bathyarchaeota archaeon]